MPIAVTQFGFMGTWAGGLDYLIEQNSHLRWQVIKSDRVGLEVGRGIVQQGGDAWVQERGDTVTLGRHPFGRVTLYWCEREQCLWFATRWRWLLPLVEPELDPLAVYGYACFSYVPTPFTPYKGIKAIEAGWRYTWREGQLVSKTSDPILAEWQEKPELLTDEDTAVEKLRFLLTAAVDQQVSDLQQATVGIALSGGLDSATIAALLKRSGLRLRAYTLDFGQYGISELPYAELVAQHLDIPLVKVACSPQLVKRSVLETALALDLPFGDGVCVPLWLLYQVAAEECDVLFNGEGGDQLFAGWTNKPLIAASIYQPELPNFTEQYLQTFHRLGGYGAEVFTPQFWQYVRDWHPGTAIESALTGRGSLLARLRRATLLLKGAQNIHPRASNLALYRGIRLRSPFCDENLAQWTFTVHSDLFLRGACEKYILKWAVEPWLPSAVVWREKRGMGVPLTQWCLQPLWRDLGRWLNPAVLAKEGIWQRDLAAKVAFGRLGSVLRKRRVGEILWLLLAWQFWHSQLENYHCRTSWRHPFLLPYWFWTNTGLYSYWRDD
ncbi:MAG: asparagine synthetase B family protein, partial [Pseudanabaenaceae cyanobacterium]